jgi:cell division protein FtsL
VATLPPDIKHKVNVTLSTAAIIFIAGVIFNAGMQYDIISNIRQHQSIQDVQITSLQNQLQPINQQLARQSQLLEDIKEEITSRSRR